VRFLAPEELSVLAALISEPYRSMVYLGGVLGMRWSEITGLRVKRVDPLGKKLLVTETLAQVGGFADVKSKASRRTLPLPDFMVQMLAEHMALRGLSGDQADELLFVGPRGGRLWYSNWHKREWAPAIEAAGLQGFTFHGLRHTSVALMVELKTHPKEIQTRLGHSSFSTTMDIYGHVLASTADGVTEGMQKMFTGADGTAMARTLQGGSQSGS
jgi:integrase